MGRKPIKRKSAEPKRGCGYRRVNKLYLIGEGQAYGCPSLPLELRACECCGFIPGQYRDFMWIPKSYFIQLKDNMIKNLPQGQVKKPCHPGCPVCYPGQNDQENYGLMWVGKKYYTPGEFIKEAEFQGVSKAIKTIPKELVYNKSWIMLAHPEAVTDPENTVTKYGKTQPVKKPGVFYAFRPQRVEMLIWKSEATSERIKELYDKGIQPIVVEDDCDAHRPQRNRGRGPGI